MFSLGAIRARALALAQGKSDVKFLEDQRIKSGELQTYELRGGVITIQSVDRSLPMPGESDNLGITLIVVMIAVSIVIGLGLFIIRFRISRKGSNPP